MRTAEGKKGVGDACLRQSLLVTHTTFSPYTLALRRGVGGQLCIPHHPTPSGVPRSTAATTETQTNTTCNGETLYCTTSSSLLPVNHKNSEFLRNVLHSQFNLEVSVFVEWSVSTFSLKVPVSHVHVPFVDFSSFRPTRGPPADTRRFSKFSSLYLNSSRKVSEKEG